MCICVPIWNECPVCCCAYRIFVIVRIFYSKNSCCSGPRSLLLICFVFEVLFLAIDAEFVPLHRSASNIYMIWMLRTAMIVRANSHVATVNIWLANLEQKWPHFFSWEMLLLVGSFIVELLRYIWIPTYIHQRRAT